MHDFSYCYKVIIPQALNASFVSLFGHFSAQNSKCEKTEREREEVVTSEVQPEFSDPHFSFRTIYDWTCEHFTEYYDDTAEGSVVISLHLINSLFTPFKEVHMSQSWRPRTI